MKMNELNQEQRLLAFCGIAYAVHRIGREFGGELSLEERHHLFSAMLTPFYRDFLTSVEKSGFQKMHDANLELQRQLEEKFELEENEFNNLMKEK